MNFKTNLLRCALMATMAFVAATTFTACGDDDEETTTSQGPTTGGDGSQTGGDDDQQTGSGDEEQTPEQDPSTGDDESSDSSYVSTSTPDVMYSYSYSTEIDQFANVVVTYWDNQGVQQTAEFIADGYGRNTWEYTFQPTISQTVGMTVTTTLLDNIDETLANYSDSASFSFYTSFYMTLYPDENDFMVNRNGVESYNATKSEVRKALSMETLNFGYTATFDAEKRIFTTGWRKQ